MKKPNCPQCSQEPKIGFWERRMMSAYGGKPCNNCNTVLKPQKWENWLTMPIFFIPLIISHNFGDSLKFWKMGLATVIAALIYVYIIAAIIPWQVQSKD